MGSHKQLRAEASEKRDGEPRHPAEPPLKQFSFHAPAEVPLFPEVYPYLSGWLGAILRALYPSYSLWPFPVLCLAQSDHSVVFHQFSELPWLSKTGPSLYPTSGSSIHMGKKCWEKKRVAKIHIQHGSPGPWGVTSHFLNVMNDTEIVCSTSGILSLVGWNVLGSIHQQSLN